MLLVQPRSDARTQVHQTRPFQRPDRSLKADWLDERSTSDGAVWITRGMTSCLPARREEVVAPPPDPPLHHPRPGIYNAVLRSDRFGTGHRLGIQNAPAGGPLQITDHSETSDTKRGQRISNLENLENTGGCLGYP